MPHGRRRNAHAAAVVIACCVSMMLASVACEREKPPSGEQAPIIVFAASSLTQPMIEAARLFEAGHSTRVTCNFAASSTLARQIESGAPCDVYISAHPQWMDYLVAKGGIIEGTPTTLVCNRLVWIVPIGADDHGFKPTVHHGDATHPPGPLPDRLAIGDPDHVPAGIYAKQALASLGLWQSLEPRIVPLWDARAALRAVESGEVDAGIVYATDAVSSKRVRVVDTFPQATHEPIRYPVARCKNANPNATALFDFLRGDECAELFNRFGFMTQCESTGTTQK